MTQLPSIRRDLAIALLVCGLTATTSVAAGTIVDAHNHTITASAPQRIVTLGSFTTETVMALEQGDRIVAADASSKGLPGAADKATLGYYRAIGAEGVLSMGPDLVVGTEAAGPPTALDQIRGAGVPVALLSDSPTLDAATHRIEALGTLLDAEPAARSIVDRIRKDLDKAAALTPATPARVLFLLSHGGGAGQMAGTDTIAHTMIELAGGTNAFASQEGYTPLTPEAALTANPDVILVTTRGLAALGGEAGIWATPGLAQLSRDKARLVSMDDNLLLGLGPRTGEAALALATHLYSDSATSP